MYRRFCKNIYFLWTMILILWINVLYAQEADELYTITGIVEALIYDEDNNVVQAGITSFVENEEESSYETFIVKDLLKGKELLNLVGKKMEVKGTLEYDEAQDVSYITVHSYIIKESEMDENENDYGEVNPEE